MWNYSVETTTLVSEITVHTRNMVVPGATASLKKRHIHQEPVNLTWYGKRVSRCSQVERRSQGVSTGPHWMIGVPTGEIWTDTQGEGHMEREAETGSCCSHIQATARTVGDPQKWGQTQGPFSLRTFRGAHCWHGDIHWPPPQPWQSTYPLFSATQFVARYYNGLRKLIQWSCSGFQN